jgi:hypothetical protein
MANLQTIGGDITAKPLNDNFNAINNEVVAFTSNANTQTAIIQRGLQNIYSDQTTPAHLKKLLGRTLVNHMGRQGDFVSQFNRWGSNLTIDTAVYKFGTSSGKIDNSAGTTTKASANPQKMYLSGKYILFGIWMKGAGGATIYPYLFGYDSAGTRTTVEGLTAGVVVDTGWRFYYKKINLTAKTDAYWDVRLDLASYGTAADVVNFDGKVVYELTSAEFSKAHTQAEIEEKYGYANSVKPIKHPYIVAYGKNLIPAFTDGWTLHANAEVVSPYELKLVADGASQGSTVSVPVVNNTSYTISLISGSVIDIVNEDGSTLITTTALSYTFNSGVNTKITIRLRNSSTAGTFTFTNPQLELGSTATTFVANNNDYAYIQGSFHSNLDGTVADVLTQVSATEWDVVRKFKDVVLDGTLGWVYSADFTGYKRVSVPTSAIAPNGYVSDSQKVVKYDGKIINNRSTIASMSGADEAVLNISQSSAMHITLADSDTGWPDAWTGTELTQDWIKAYANGWKYTGTSDKATLTWVSVYNGANAPTQTLAYVSANRASGMTDANAHLLTYQLANEVDEAVSLEFALNMHAGDNAFEFGEGAVLKEPANPKLSGGNYNINIDADSSTLLKNRVDKILVIYKNNKPDTKWKIVAKGGSYTSNGERAYIPEADFDKTAQYTVTSILLDKHEHTVNVVESELSYNTNLKTAFDRLVQDATDTQAEVDAIQWDIERRLLKGEGERVESGTLRLTYSATTILKATLTFKRSFSEPPKVMFEMLGSTAMLKVDVKYFELKSTTSVVLVVRDDGAGFVSGDYVDVDYIIVGK